MIEYDMVVRSNMFEHQERDFLYDRGAEGWILVSVIQLNHNVNQYPFSAKYYFYKVT